VVFDLDLNMNVNTGVNLDIDAPDGVDRRKTGTCATHPDRVSRS
jgi:hypothetical protein